MSYSFFLPQNITVGAHSLGNVGRLASKLHSKKALILSGPSLLKHGVVDQVMAYLEESGVTASYFTEIEANPSVTTVSRATEAFRESGADLIIALGGGSPMDVAKAVAILGKYSGTISDYEGAHKVPGPVIPMIAIPTTAGTGSEVTAFSVITDHERDYKFTVFSYEILPDYAILDPELITTVPKSVAAACGMDALIHALESYISKDANPFTEAMSEKALELIGGAIRTYVADRRNLAAAESMLVGSLFAGIAFSFARLGNVHAMSHPISAVYNVPHGLANAVLLPSVLAFNEVCDRGKYEKVRGYLESKVRGFSANLHVGGPAVAEVDTISAGAVTSAPDLVGVVRDLMVELGIPDGILAAVRECGNAPELMDSDFLDKIPFLTADAMKSGNIAVNPRTTTAEDVAELYRKAM